MTETHARNADQVASWNGSVGQRWVERQEFMDSLLAPVSAELLSTAAPRPGFNVIDIGCGNGETTLRLAERVSPGGHVTGLDISAPMLARARLRTPPEAPVSFIEGDATVHPFAPGAADLLFSRFGVMFFAEPVVAFANMRSGLRPGARVCFACWRPLRVNQWQVVPLEAVRGLLPPTPPADPDAPGPYAFADDARVVGILSEAGFSGVEARAVDLTLDVATGAGIDAAVTSALEIGPSARALADQPPAVRAAAAEAIRQALLPFEKDGHVWLDAAIWIVTATNP